MKKFNRVNFLGILCIFALSVLITDLFLEFLSISYNSIMWILIFFICYLIIFIKYFKNHKDIDSIVFRLLQLTFYLIIIVFLIPALVILWETYQWTTGTGSTGESFKIIEYYNFFDTLEYLEKM